MNFLKKLKSLNVFDYIFVLLEVIILVIMFVFQIKTMVDCSDLVKYAHLYYPMVKICRLFVIGLPFLWIIAYFISHIIDDKHKLLDIKNLMVIYILIGLIANIFIFIDDNNSIINMSLFLGSYLLLCVILLKDVKELIIHAISLMLFLAISFFIPSLNNVSGVIASLCFGLLISNLILTIFKYIKTKDKYYLYMLFSILFALISDGCIGLRTILTNTVSNNIFSMIVWPTYVINLILFIFSYNIYHQGLDSKEN